MRKQLIKNNKNTTYFPYVLASSLPQRNFLLKIIKMKRNERSIYEIKKYGGGGEGDPISNMPCV